MIRFLQHYEIDRIAWDNCIENSQQGLIYGLSWYLDLVSPGWCALAENDYEAVMPLPVKKKFGINYIIQPVYAQQLGIFSATQVSAEKVSEFISAIPDKYKFLAVNLNFANHFVSGDFKLRSNANYELSLEPDYDYLYRTFSSNTQRNIQKAVGLNINFEGTADELIELKTENTAKGRRRLPAEYIKKFVSVFLENGKGFICKASVDDKPCAAVFFIYHNKRIYYLIPVSNPTGKEKKAMFAIIDLLIQKFAGSNLVLDFEGSNIPGLARFFEGFAAENVNYSTLTINRLPFPLNLFKR